MTNKSSTVQEAFLRMWLTQVAHFPVEELRSKVIAANSLTFVEIVADRYKLGHVHVKQILTLMVERLLQEGIKIPDGGAFDLQGIARSIKTSKSEMPL